MIEQVLDDEQQTTDGQTDAPRQEPQAPGNGAPKNGIHWTEDDVTSDAVHIRIGNYTYRQRHINFGLCRRFSARQLKAFERAQESNDMSPLADLNNAQYDLLFEPLDDAPPLVSVMDGLDLDDPVLEAIHKRCEVFFTKSMKQYQRLVNANPDLGD